MSTILQKPTAEEASQIQFILDQYLDEVRRLNTIMDADQKQIDQIRAETRQIGTQTRATIANIHEILTKLEAL